MLSHMKIIHLGGFDFKIVVSSPLDCTTEHLTDLNEYSHGDAQGVLIPRMGDPHSLGKIGLWEKILIGILGFS